MRYLLLVFLLMLSGCASVGKVYLPDEKGRIDEDNPCVIVELSAKGALSYENGDIKVTLETRQPTCFDRFIKPIITSAADKSQAQVN